MLTKFLYFIKKCFLNHDLGSSVLDHQISPFQGFLLGRTTKSRRNQKEAEIIVRYMRTCIVVMKNLVVAFSEIRSVFFSLLHVITSKLSYNKFVFHLIWFFMVTKISLAENISCVQNLHHEDFGSKTMPVQFSNKNNHILPRVIEFGIFVSETGISSVFSLS